MKVSLHITANNQKGLLRSIFVLTIADPSFPFDVQDDPHIMQR